MKKEQPDYQGKIVIEDGDASLRPPITLSPSPSSTFPIHASPNFHHLHPLFPPSSLLKSLAAIVDTSSKVDVDREDLAVGANGLISGHDHAAQEGGYDAFVEKMKSLGVS
jgi:hypothetical protein